jgi:DNA-binding XRE family transcriptional regulator
VRTGSDYRAIREAMGMSRAKLGEVLEVTEGAILARERQEGIRRELFLALSAVANEQQKEATGSPVVFL